MANKALKTLAASNTKKLNSTLIAALAIHVLFHISRLIFNAQRRSLKIYLILSLPSILLQGWIESIGRPSYNPDGSVKRSGEDLEGKGLMEWMFDVIYWTLINILMVAIFGNWAWTFWVVVPAYSGYLAYTVFAGARGMMGGLSGGDGQAHEGSGGQSKSQVKKERKMQKMGR